MITLVFIVVSLRKGLETKLTRMFTVHQHDFKRLSASISWHTTPNTKEALDFRAALNDRANQVVIYVLDKPRIATVIRRKYPGAIIIALTNMPVLFKATTKPLKFLDPSSKDDDEFFLAVFEATRSASE
jgi:hypothetical protein